ncbi:MAG: CAP domain-containing protein [Rhodothermaceae bacterium]|nr:CAP domain-containing protein [Rhodothermaceae bacterium]
MRMNFIALLYGTLLGFVCLHCTQAPPPAQFTPPSDRLYDLDDLEQSIHEIVNQERADENLSLLEWNDKLSVLARNHSADMLAKGYFSHESLDGRTPSDRAAEAGFECVVETGGSQRIGIGENILTTVSYHSIEVSEFNGKETTKFNWKSADELAREIVRTWMNSRGHRRNILRHDYIQQGIGAVVGEDQKIFVTQNFC